MLSTMALRLMRLPAAPSEGQNPEPRQLMPRPETETARAARDVKTADFIFFFFNSSRDGCTWGEGGGEGCMRLTDWVVEDEWGDPGGTKYDLRLCFRRHYILAVFTIGSSEQTYKSPLNLVRQG